MKPILKSALCTALITMALSTVNAQELASLSTSGYTTSKTEAEKPAAPATVKQDLVITLKNSSEKPIVIFAGPKEEIRNPKIQTYGGLSKNTLYLQPNNVVCLMSGGNESGETKMVACTLIKPETKQVEVNTSSTTISSK